MVDLVVLAIIRQRMVEKRHDPRVLEGGTVALVRTTLDIWQQFQVLRRYRDRHAVVAPRSARRQRRQMPSVLVPNEDEPLTIHDQVTALDHRENDLVALTTNFCSPAAGPSVTASTAA